MQIKNNTFSTFFCLILFFVFLSAACSIPFYFESPSMYYKTGMDRFMLRSGKILGIITAVFMLTQPVLIGRFLFLNQTFSVKKLFKFHRINGMMLLITALIHPILILGADHFVFFPVELRYWPEFMGVLLLFILIIFVAMSVWQKPLGLAYKTWRFYHKIIAPLILILMFIHVFNVSKSFESGAPFYFLGAAGIITLVLFLRKYLH